MSDSLYRETACGRWHYDSRCPICESPSTRARRNEPRLCRTCSNRLRRGARYPNRAMWWTRERIIAAMLDWLFRHGRWPTTRDWARATTEHPTKKTVYDRFGTWNRAKRAAGWRAA